MGGSGSTRWKNHQKAPRVEDAFELDVMGLAPALQHDQIDGELSLTDSQTGEVNSQFSFSLGPVSVGGSRLLMIDPGDNSRKQPIHLERAQRGWYSGWLFRCPSDCGQRARKLYALPRWLVFTCRACAGLTYRSSQRHDARLDQLLRDPLGFQMARNRAPQTPDSDRVTTWLMFAALERRTKTRKGRGWGRKSTTPWTRMAAEMRADYERRWGFPPEAAGRIARGG